MAWPLLTCPVAVCAKSQEQSLGHSLLQTQSWYVCGEHHSLLTYHSLSGLEHQLSFGCVLTWLNDHLDATQLVFGGVWRGSVCAAMPRPVPHL